MEDRHVKYMLWYSYKERIGYQNCVLQCTGMSIVRKFLVCFRIIMKPFQFEMDIIGYI